jgi:hypothetical protein
MTEKVAHHRNIDTGLQECNRATVAHYMWRDAALA